MNNVGEIDLDKCNYKNCFWDFTKNSFDTIMDREINRDFIRLQNKLFRLKLYKTNDKKIITCKLKNDNYDLCMTFTLIKSIYGIYIHLSNLTNNCSSYLKNNNTSGTRILLNILDKIALMFGAYRIFLQDAATPSVYSNMKLKYDLDFTLITVMKEGKMFYEKYGYNVCDPESVEYPIKKINLELQKNLLRNFKFDLFKLFLDFDDLFFVNKILKNNNKSFTTLADFYVYTLEHITTLINKELEIDEDKYLKYKNYINKLQEIILNENYPWSGMVSVIQSEKYCMEKLF